MPTDLIEAGHGCPGVMNPRTPQCPPQADANADRGLGATLTHMPSTIGIRSLQQTASKVVARVVAGESLTVTDRGRPVARLVPIADSAVEQLLASGAARPARGAWHDLPDPLPVSGPSLSDLLWTARADER